MTGTYYALFVVTAVAAVLFLIAGVVMFFLFNIPKIVGHLTGYTARKQIKLMQSKSVSVNERRSESENTLNQFMQQQRNIAAQVKNNDETETVNLPTEDVVSAAREAVNQIPASAVDNNTAAKAQPAANPTGKLNLQKPAAAAENEPKAAEEVQQEQPATQQHITEEIKFKFDVLLSLDFINTDEVI